MLPPPCFTVEMVLGRWWAVPGVLHHSAIKPRLVEGCSDSCLSRALSHLPTASLELSQSDLWVLLYLSHQGSSPPDAQFGRTASSRKSPGRPKLLPFKDYGGHCALRNLKCNRIVFVAMARSVPCHNSLSSSGSSFDLMITCASKAAQVLFSVLSCHLKDGVPI